jgi:hypothetical protein
MYQEPFDSKMRVFVLSEWRIAIHKGEETFSRLYDDEIGSPAHIAKIVDFAQLKLISGRVTLKESWLTQSEMSYAHTLFEEHRNSSDYFNILKFQEKSAQPNALVFRHPQKPNDEKQMVS